MSDTTFATLRASVEQFRQMIKQSALEGETEHSDIYLNILEDEVRILQAAPGEVVLTYCSFNDNYFNEIDLHREVREVETTDNQGNDLEVEVGAEAILNVEDTLDYIDHASEGGTIEMEFTGSEDRRLCSTVTIDGALEAWVRLPGSSDILSDVPHWLPFRFNSNNVYTNTQGDEAPTQVSTKAEKIRKIISITDDSDQEFYPITVKDGELRIDVGNEEGSGVSGALTAQSVEGPDVDNYYYDGFEEIFNVLSGPVELQTAPGNNPLSVVQEDNQGRVVRHVNGSVNN